MSIVRNFYAAFRMVFFDITRSSAAITATFYIRIYYFLKIRRRLRTAESDDAFAMTIPHNMRSLYKRPRRMLALIKPLSALEQVAKTSRILVIGPRNEWDILLLYQHGFKISMSTGLDLISYSPWISVGDMHSLPFEDCQFDVVLCGWTISYSADPNRACTEIARVCKATGIIGIGVEYSDADEDGIRLSTGGYLIQDSRLKERVNSVSAILELFPNHGAVVHANDAPLRKSLPRDSSPSNCVVLFERCARHPQPVAPHNRANK